jgi:nucleoside-diphosphate-sugar epimerase
MRGRAIPILLPDGGDARMQWVFAPDVAEACVRAIEVPEAVGEAFNVGHVEPTTRRSFVEALARAAGVEPTPLDEALRVSFDWYREQPRRPVDCTFADRLLAMA